MSGYNATLNSGSEIYIPYWTPTVALENLTMAGKYIGADFMIEIAKLDILSAIVAITEAEDAKQTIGLIKNFVCSARVDGEKIQPNTFDKSFEANLYEVVELFAHVVKAQYASFFDLGLPKETSQSD